MAVVNPTIVMGLADMILNTSSVRNTDVGPIARISFFLDRP